jgi:hypothetical protein
MGDAIRWNSQATASPPTVSGTAVPLLPRWGVREMNELQSLEQLQEPYCSRARVFPYRLRGFHFNKWAR